MPYQICKQFEVESGHILSKHPGRCRFPHGHTRRVEIILEAEELNENGMVCDFGALKESVAPLVDALDHSICMNTADPMFGTMREAYGDQVIGFNDQDPTSEVLVHYFYDVIKAAIDAYRNQPECRFPIRDQVRLAYVRIWETSTSWAQYSE
jgi:6-pyruvoyltetrahydropterin/6-carboxytetrahydropterin synthase